MKNIIYLFCISILLVSCGSDDSSDSDDVLGGFNSGYLKADVNGVTIEFNLGPNSIAATLVDGGFTGGEAFTFSLAATSSGLTETLPVTTIALLLFTNNPNIPNGGVAFDENDNLGGLYTYTEDLDFGPIIEASNGFSNSINLTISSVNQQNGTMSGTFSFEAEDSISGDPYIVTNGVFTNVIFINDSSSN